MSMQPVALAVSDACAALAITLQQFDFGLGFCTLEHGVAKRLELAAYYIELCAQVGKLAKMLQVLRVQVGAHAVHQTAHGGGVIDGPTYHCCLAVDRSR